MLAQTQALWTSRLFAGSLQRGRNSAKNAIDLVFGPDPDAPPLGILWDLISCAVVSFMVAALLTEADSPHDLGGIDGD